jgi:hypothetical protein
MEIRAGNYRSGNLGPVELSDAPRRIRFHPASILESLLDRIGLWCHRVGLQLVLHESRSCLHRIRQVWKSRTGIPFETVADSLPTLDGSDSRIERQPYIVGIQALERERPWLSLGDCELFLQGWFQAVTHMRSRGSEACKAVAALEYDSPMKHEPTAEKNLSRGGS